jgi:hypothetical protein
MEFPSLLKSPYVLAALAVVGLIVVKKSLPAVIPNAVAGAVGVVADAAAGAAIGIGDLVGVPRTNETECAKALREGRMWDASFSCPAGTYLSGLGGSIGTNIYDWTH